MGTPPAALHLVSRGSPLAFAGLDLASLSTVRRGVFARTSEWEALFADGRLRTRAAAVMQRLQSPIATFSHATALALHGIPVFRWRSDRVDMIVPSVSTRHDSRDVVRHQAALAPEDIVLVDGARVTSLERALYDTSRMLSLEAAVVAFDAALRRVAWDESDNTYDVAAAEDLRERVGIRIADHHGARGIRQARFVAGFADGRSGSPGESIARLWMWQLGVPEPELQLRVELPGGRYALLDFAWPHLSRWAEFDGAAKYTDETLLAGRTTEEVLAEQAEREDAIRRTTGWRCDRWGFERMPSLDEFARHLRSLGL